MPAKKVYIASDHGGFLIKKKLVSFLKQKGWAVEDLGPFTLQPDDDYPDYAIPMAKKVAGDKNSLGIVACRNGQGVCIASNKVKGIRAVTGFSRQQAETTRKDDNANILCLPADYLSEPEIKNIVSAWLGTDFSNAARHKRRLRKVSALEK
ncbi:MAG TPA: RpiB/LacA/LacB family sugar-phosphate isomerase [Candidatus Nanoarchaeia archaeon]|nr:RpiB/LacA/LacB family sugar-phosphate isomerase [Candidatus Nanoarchaeia archaeon]